jgi:ribonuclease HI
MLEGMTRDETTVYTDGACLGNPGPGGWAWAVPGGPFRSGAQSRTTNQRMELQAVLDAVGHFRGPLDIASDSTYVVNCFRDRWWEGWLRRGWTNSQKKPVANRDLWAPLVEAYLADPGRLRFRWVKGHSSDTMNDLVDRLAVEAARTQEGREGDAPPADVGPPDKLRSAAGSPAASPDMVPAGHRILVAGLRPPSLGGYGETPMAASVRKQVGDILAAKAELHPDLVVLSGLGLGAEQLGVEAAVEHAIPYAAILAFPGQDARWPAPSRAHFAELMQGAVKAVVLQRRPPTGQQGAAGALARRDAWLARNASEAIVVWDHRDQLVGRLVRSLQDQLGEEEVWIVEP